MGKKDPRVDKYIIKSQEFAQPILHHIRELIHKGCPEVEETMKWSFPHFNYKGILCSMAAFKEHCTVSFWKGSLIPGLPDKNKNSGGTAMGQFGRITSLDDLPPDKILIGIVRKARKLNEDGIKSPTRSRPVVKKDLVIPEFFAAALKKNKKAASVFDGFSYSHKKEYVEWISEAKTEITRNKRLATAVEWIMEGKIRNWKYLKK
jgi:uncharacterized protein YdeI (YjbR/CyaY-like superfamily)